MNKFTFTEENIYKVLRGAGIALGGALLTYLAQFFASTDFGVYTPLVVAVSTILINAGREYLKK